MSGNGWTSWLQNTGCLARVVGWWLVTFSDWLAPFSHRVLHTVDYLLCRRGDVCSGHNSSQLVGEYVYTYKSGTRPTITNQWTKVCMYLTELSNTHPVIPVTSSRQTSVLYLNHCVQLCYRRNLQEYLIIISELYTLQGKLNVGHLLLSMIIDRYDDLQVSGQWYIYILLVPISWLPRYSLLIVITNAKQILAMFLYILLVLNRLVFTRAGLHIG